MSDAEECGVVFGGDFEQELADDGCVFGVKVAGRFIGQKKRRSLDQGAADRDSLTFSSRESCRAVVQAVLQTNTFQQRGCSLFRVSFCAESRECR